MTLVQYDRVQETSTTTGTGTYTLAGAVLGYQSFAVVGNGNTCYYCAMGVDGNGNPNGDGWEVGLGTYASGGTTLARTTILASTNANAAVNWAAGTRRIFVTLAAAGILPKAVQGPGTTVQEVNTSVVTSTTGTTQIPSDDTIPQITEGTEFMTLAITPTSATNKLHIRVVICLGSDTATRTLIAALFQDATANALNAGVTHMVTATAVTQIIIDHYMLAGTTSATTFRVRAGANNTGTTTFNGSSGSRLLGGVLTSSITITEIQP